jgi:hypothetical protein
MGDYEYAELAPEDEERLVSKIASRMKTPVENDLGKNEVVLDQESTERLVAGVAIKMAQVAQGLVPPEQTEAEKIEALEEKIAELKLQQQQDAEDHALVDGALSEAVSHPQGFQEIFKGMFPRKKREAQADE